MDKDITNPNVKPLYFDSKGKKCVCCEMSGTAIPLYKLLKENVIVCYTCIECLEKKVH